MKVDGKVAKLAKVDGKLALSWRKVFGKLAKVDGKLTEVGGKLAKVVGKLLESWQFDFERKILEVG